MSYNGYNNANSYSPYFQDGPGQHQDQSNNTGAYQSASYQPLSARQSNQQPAPAAPQSASVSAHRNQGYGSVNHTVYARIQDTRASYTDSGRSVDTSALGNLAYVSSLGRDSPSLQHIMDYNHTQSSGGYGNSNAYGMSSSSPVQYGTGPGRTDSSGSIAVSGESPASRTQQGVSVPSYGYPPDNGYYNFQEQPTSAGTSGEGRAPQTTSRLSTTSQYTSQPPRPASSQAAHNSQSRATSRATYQSLQSPTLPANQAVSSSSGSGSGSVRDSEQQRIQSLLQQVDRTIGTPKDFRSEAPTSGVAHFPALTTGLQPNSIPLPTQANNAIQRSTADAPAPGTPGQVFTPASDENPTTVDPSQVFNHYEYSRRQAAAAAEAEAARKKASEAAQAIENMRNNSSSSKEKVPAASEQRNGTISGKDLDPETAKRNQMELEMKQMIEKMRDYKSKDPSLFSQIWEQVKKGQPAQRAPSQAASQGSQIVLDSQIPSPGTAQGQLPPESELPPAQEVLDRGKCPSVRQTSGGKRDTPSRGSTPSTSGQIAPDSGTQTMRKDMGCSQRNSNSPTSSKSIAALVAEEQVSHRTTTAPSITAPVKAQQQFQPLKAGGTYWPEKSKRSLAEAARIALTTLPPNVGKQITTEEIHQLLDQNPSYKQMCEILEHRGFLIDRGQFARLLLCAVPDLSLAAAPKTNEKPSSTWARPPPPQPQTTIHTPTQGAAPPPPPSTEPPKDPYISPYCPPSNAVIPPQGSQYSANTRDYRVVEPARWTANERRQQSDANARSTPHVIRTSLKPVAEPMAEPTTTQSATNGNTTNGTQQGESLEENGGQNRKSTVNEGETYSAVVSWADKRKLTETSRTENTDERGRLPPQLHVINKSSIHTVQPPSKQDMARKRSFGDIVDLTQLSEDERPLLRPRLVGQTPLTSPLPTSATVPAVLTISSNAANPAQKHVNGHVSSAIPARANDPKTGSNSPKYIPSGREHLWYQDIIRPLNKRQDALRRSRYDPRTIASDILLAVGKHPTMYPLNAHLHVLRDKFQSVNSGSDLGTFRWDLVDPGRELPNDADGNDADDEDADVSNHTSYHRSQISVAIGGDTIRTDVVIPHADSATALVKDITPRRHRGRPSRGGRNGLIGPLRTEGAGASSQQEGSLCREEVIQNQQQTSHQVPQGNDSQDLVRFSYTDSASVRTPSAVTDTPLRSFDATSYTYSTPIDPSQSTTLTSTSGSGPKRKGRPPGAKNKNPRPDKGIPKKKTQAQNPGSTGPFQNTGDGLASNRDSSNSARDLAQDLGSSVLPMQNRLRISTDTATPTRPSGLRNAITPTDGIAVVVPSRSPSIANKAQTGSAERVLLRKMPVPSGRHPYEPSYKIYKCCWEKCLAELHNLKTLRKHVLKHLDRFKETPFPCLWANCYDSNITLANKPQGDGSNDSSQRQRMSFNSSASWEKHMEGKHVNAIAWELGDGPATHSSDYDSSDYMSDSRSRQATPSTRI